MVPLFSRVDLAAVASMVLGIERRARLVLGALIAMLGVSLAATADPSQPEAMGRPAPRSANAAHSMILSLERAGDRVVAVGERGFILLSDDNGRSWHQAATPTSVTLTVVRFATKLDGWAAGHMGVVLRTNDGGVTWRRELDGVRAAELVLSQVKQHLAVAPDDPQAAAALKEAEQLVDDGPDKPFLGMLVGNANHVLVVGAFGIAFTSEDGGASWIPVMSLIENPSGYHIYAAVATEDVRYLAGERGLFLRSENGQPFTPFKTPYQGTFFGMLTGPEHLLILFGLQGTVLRSEDRGSTWQGIEVGIDQTITCATELDDGRIVLGSQSGQIAISSDRGKSFRRVAAAPEPIATLIQASDGALIIGGPAGPVRMDLAKMAIAP